MTERHRGGDKRSSWLTFRRRLFLARRLIRGPASAATLIAEARSVFDDEIYPPDANAALRHDLAALRLEFDCRIEYKAGTGYSLTHPGQLALLDLPDAELEALAFLTATFADSPLPNNAQVSSLLGRVAGLLPANRQELLQRSPAYPHVEQPAAGDAAAAKMLATLKRAIRRGQVAFEYRSSLVPGAAPVRHRVAPYDIIYRDGHTYLDAFCYECPIGELVNRYNLYRLDRIVAGTLKLLPTQLPPGEIPRRLHQLRYWLSPQVAKLRDIARWFPESKVEFYDDGSALVSAQAGDLWQARQILLRYREHCRVLAPPELIAMMRDSITRMAALYHTTDTVDGDVLKMVIGDGPAATT
jgi:predicted DNA-binding transcriptional regulator YafY